jgi:glutathione synthase/RimK-type ligase-like ATP-grasp enzyme
MTPTVLIIAPNEDAHALTVAKRLEELDAETIILDSAHFPSRWQLSVSVANDGLRHFVLSRDDLEISHESLVGVWWRRPRRYLASGEVQEAHLRRLAASEARAAFEGWLHCLGERVINPIAADRAASHKLFQLQAAVEVGLTIPRSLATNSPCLAREFCQEYGPTIYKPFVGTDWQLIATQRLSDDALGHLDAVSYAPVLFQEEIRKSADIRVNIVDSQVFAMLIKPVTEDAPIDWRVDRDREYQTHLLPEGVRASLLALMAKLGLRFAACDLALSEDGEYVFFEANAGGQWLFAEIMVGQEISRAFARALLRK